jgi:hypothetical protein
MHPRRYGLKTKKHKKMDEEEWIFFLWRDKFGYILATWKGEVRKKGT